MIGTLILFNANYFVLTSLFQLSFNKNKKCIYNNPL